MAGLSVPRSIRWLARAPPLFVPVGLESHDVSRANAVSGTLPVEPRMVGTERGNVDALQSALKVGDEVVVFVPWQMRDDDYTPTMGPYWEGEIVESGPSPVGGPGVVYSIRKTYAGGETADAPFHEKWVFPAELRDRVRIMGGVARRRLVVRDES